jgi:hypothetical protein
MITYPIPKHLAESIDVNEWAIAAILRDRVVALLYISDIAPNITRFLGTTASEFVIKRWAEGNPPDLLKLQKLGRVSAGKITSKGFNLYWELTEWNP